MAEPFIGTIQAYGFNFAPRGWATCQGQVLAIAQNSALFSLLGTTYGGNGQTTFQLPNLGGRVPNGQGQSPGLSPYSMGQISGTETVTLTTQQMPAHNHSLNASTTVGATSAPAAGNVLGCPTGQDETSLNPVAVTIYAPAPATPTIALAPASIGANGGNQPFSIMQPYLTINWSIALEGIFPSRN
ncbi:phage tail protein [Brevundimonas sp. Root1279]|uniref:phage tail protein n=1 Tax=Brevundimonas sp. Root1279 TaxID=1736443 RepID=UPI0006FCB61A|nr:tail fiber protein [Brevundimonas sp. Root1279]KQW81828.1 phage tail protein [Brevundimonas sp. Root1279]